MKSCSIICFEADCCTETLYLFKNFELKAFCQILITIFSFNSRFKAFSVASYVGDDGTTLFKTTYDLPMHRACANVTK